MHTFEQDFPFCSNPCCELHVRAGDAHVAGCGNWAQMSDGRLIGRGVYNGIFLCDPCGRAAVGAITVRTSTNAAA